MAREKRRKPRDGRGYGLLQIKLAAKHLAQHLPVESLVIMKLASISARVDWPGDVLLVLRVNCRYNTFVPVPGSMD